MRLLRVEVWGFRGIRHAAIELGRGLNVLYGPNDLGKSSLAEAIRAALLLTYSSAEGDKYHPWQEDAVPKVQLSFLHEGQYYRLTKSFGQGNRGGATLEISRDGQKYAAEAKGREVEQKVRELLRWGVNNPGGKSGARGMPETFLSKALLAGQTEVDAILAQSLAADPDEGGRLRLTSALSALAQDPRFKAVLEQAQDEVDRRFTEKGQYKRGKDSELRAAQERVELLTQQLETLRGGAARASAIEARLREARDAAMVAKDARTAAEQALAEAKARALVEAELAQATAAHSALELERSRLSSESAELARRSAVVEAKEAAVASTRQAETAATEALARAEEALRSAQAGAEGAARQLEESQLKTRILERRSLALAAEAELKGAQSIVAARQALSQAEAEAKAARARLEQETKAVASAEAEVELVAALRDLGAIRQLKQAVSRAEEAAAALETAAKAVTEAEAVVSKLRAAIEGDGLPSLEEAQKIAALERALQLAEARLGGGLTVRARAEKGVSVRTAIDGKAPVAKKAEFTVAGDRTMLLEIPGVLSLEILAGAASARAEAEAARAAWEAIGPGILERTKAATAEGLLTLCQKRHALLREAVQKLDNLRAQSEAPRGGASASELAEKQAELAAAEAALARGGRDKYRPAFDKLGADWATKLPSLISHADTTKAQATARRAEAERAAADAETSLAVKRESLRGLLAQLPAGPSTAPAPELQTRAAALKGEVAALEAELQGLAAGQAQSVKAAESELAARRKAVAEAQAAVRTAAQALEAARGERDQIRGVVSELEARVLAQPWEQAGERLRAAQAALAKHPPSAQTVAAREAELERARLLADQATAEVNRAEGELRQSAGAAAREQIQELERAILDAKEEAKRVEVDAQAWQLLLTTLKESEAVGTKHLGKLLGDRVEPRFRDLTLGTYGALELGTDLVGQHINAAGGGRNLDSISVGTREQLATILRLTVAEALDSLIILDDQLVQSDRGRLEWFNRALKEAASKIQVIVITCRPEDYSLVEGERTLIELLPKLERYPKVAFVEAAVRAAKPEEVAAPAPQPPSLPAPDEKTPLAEILRAAAVELGMSQQDIASAVQAGAKTVQQWLDGAAEPRGKFRERLVEVLGRGAPEASARARAVARLQSSTPPA